MPNRLTPLYSKIYYKKKNYLKVKTVVFKYITPPHSKGLGILAYWYINMPHVPIFLRSYIPNSCYMLFMWLGYPLSYSFTSSISPTSCALILTCLKSCLNIYTILFIKSIIYKVIIEVLIEVYFKVITRRNVIFIKN